MQVTSGGGEANGRRSAAWLLLYALAYGGGAIAYVPLLTLLLPLKVEEIAPTEKLALLGLITVAGAAAASVSNIVVGMLSDRVQGRRVRWSAGRRPWIVAGLFLTVTALAGIAVSRSPVELIAAVVAFQIVLNVLLAPLVALAADEVPDEQKGTLGGLIGAAYPMGSIAAILVTAFPQVTETAQLAMVSGLAALTIVPFLMFAPRPAEMLSEIEPEVRPARGATDLVVVWLSRVLMQVAGLILFAFFLFYFESVQHEQSDVAARILASRIAWLSGLVAVLTVPLAVVLGRLSDRLGARKPVLMTTAAAAVAGLLVMAAFPQWTPAAFGYVVFACASGVYLALQAVFAMRVLPSPKHRGRDLGFLNLANTLPSLIGPWLTVAVVAQGGFRSLIVVLAIATALAGGLMAFVKESPSEA